MESGLAELGGVKVCSGTDMDVPNERSQHRLETRWYVLVTRLMTIPSPPATPHIPLVVLVFTSKYRRT
jgi:hypothetical protein